MTLHSAKARAAVSIAIANAVSEQGFELSAPQALYVGLCAIDAMEASLAKKGKHK